MSEPNYLSNEYEGATLAQLRSYMEIWHIALKGHYERMHNDGQPVEDCTVCMAFTKNINLILHHIDALNEPK